MIQKTKPFLKVPIASVFLLTTGVCCTLYPLCGNNLPEIISDLCLLISPLMGGILIKGYALSRCEISGIVSYFKSDRFPSRRAYQ